MRKTKGGWEPLYRTTYIPLTDEQIAEHIRIAREEHGVEATREQVIEAATDDEIWTNRLYQCAVRYLDGNPFGWLHLSIKRRNKGVIRDWRDLQRIKNDVAGQEREGFEIFPAESRLVDTANQYHLWVMPEGEKLDIGFFPDKRLVTAEVGRSGARQRPFR